MKTITLHINGTQHTLAVEENCTLLHLLREELGLTGTKYGCGTADCGRCACDNTDRELQTYQPQGNNDIIWCFGVSSMEYHCSTAVLVGAAE